MTVELSPPDVAGVFGRRDGPIGRLAVDAPALAAACHGMAQRFHRGGRLIAFGAGCSAADVAHVVVEFVHPVIIGKRALPAFALPGGPAGFAAELDLFAEPGHIALALAADGGDDQLAGWPLGVTTVCSRSPSWAAPRVWPLGCRDWTMSSRCSRMTLASRERAT